MAAEKIMSLDYINSTAASNSPFQPNFTPAPYYGESNSFVPARPPTGEAYPAYNQPGYPKPQSEDEYAANWGCEAIRPNFYGEEVMAAPTGFPGYPGDWKGVPQRQDMVYSPKSAGSNATQPVNIGPLSEDEDEESLSGESCSEEMGEGGQVSVYPSGAFHQERYPPNTTAFQRPASGDPHVPQQYQIDQQQQHQEKLQKNAFGMAVKPNEVRCLKFTFSINIFNFTFKLNIFIRNIKKGLS